MKKRLFLFVLLGIFSSLGQTAEIQYQGMTYYKMIMHNDVFSLQDSSGLTVLSLDNCSRPPLQELWSEVKDKIKKQSSIKGKNLPVIRAGRRKKNIPIWSKNYQFFERLALSTHSYLRRVKRKCR